MVFPSFLIAFDLNAFGDYAVGNCEVALRISIVHLAFCTSLRNKLKFQIRGDC